MLLLITLIAMLKSNKHCLVQIKYNPTNMALRLWRMTKRNELLIPQPRCASFVLFAQASEPSLNFNISKMAYEWKDMN